MYINSQNKQLQLRPLQGIITQGEKMADSVTFALPAVYGSLSLSDLSWSIRAASEKDTLATAALVVSTANDKCLLTWEVSSDFTAVSGALSLMLVGTDGDGNVVIKFPGDSPIWVRDSETGEYSPPEDAIENALNGLQQAESALEDATKALQEIGINFKILGHYGTLPELEAAVTNPSPGDAYGVGEPTVIYVWNGTSWAPLPGVFQPYPHTNLLVNPRFKYNSRGQSTYTGAVWTVDGWRINPGVTLSVGNNVITITASSGSAPDLWQPISISEIDNICGNTVTFSVCDNSKAIYTITAKLPDEPTGTNTMIGSQDTPWGYIQLWNTNYTSFEGEKTFASIVRVNSSASLIAAKLELGSVSTLQAELDNPPPEDVEKLKLDMYSLDPGRCAYLPWRNKNLLDNWYFVGGGSQQGGGQFPINQRGETSYGAASGYGIDRWFNGAIALTPQGLKMSSATILYQRLENIEIFTGETLTYSVLWSDGKLLTITGTPDQMQVVNDGDRSIRFAIDSSLSILLVSIQSLDATEKTAVAAKLEFGDTQTLAYQDEEGNWRLFETPDYAEELARCQRYLLVLPGFNTLFSNIGVGSFFLETEAEITIPTPTTMRIVPTCVATGNWLLRGAGQVINAEAGVSNFFVPQMSSNAVSMVINGLSGCPVNQVTQLVRDNNSTAKITLSAEL